jgi:hypothetical protein
MAERAAGAGGLRGSGLDEAAGEGGKRVACEQRGSCNGDIGAFDVNFDRRADGMV